MYATRRALIIGLLGPAIQGAGLLWQAAHFYVSHFHGAFSVRHLVFEPGLLMVVVGLIVTLVCVPLAIEVAAASEADLEIPAFGTAEEATPVSGLRLPGHGGTTTLHH